MSQYKVISTEYRNPESLIAAINEIVGHQCTVVSPDCKANTLALYGYQGDQRDEKVAVRINRDIVNRYSGGASNDIGFRWNGQSYEVIASEFDTGGGSYEGQDGVFQFLGRVKQRYALHEVRRKAASKGYTVRETTQPGGTIQLSLVRR